MTLKERAEKFANVIWSKPEYSSQSDFEDCVTAYEAGFREAIGLALEIARNNRLPELADPDTWTHNSVCSDIEFSLRALAEESK